MSLRRRLEKYWLDWRTLPADAALSYRNNGFPGIWKTLAPRTIHRVFRHGRLIVFAQALDRVADILPPPGVRIAPLEANEWPALASIVTRRDLNRFRELVARGRHCLVAWRGERPIGYAWVAEGAGPDVSMVPLPLPDDAAYLWDLYVLPAERCNGIGSALATARLNIARARGFREGWRTIAPSNRASLRTLEKSGTGSRMVGEVRYLKLVTRMYVRFTPQTGPSTPAN